ncbi:hypothetical protein BKA93DRAFT_740339 [Sparassis latifolia]
MAAKDVEKRRRPPTFQHLPEDRAKKLKRSWVEVQKVKSRWKAQKRKEGLMTDKKRKPLEGETENGDEVSEHEEMEASSSKDKDCSSEDEDGDEDNVSVVPSPRPLPPKMKQEYHGDEAEKPSLREMNRQAYSRTSLHTHKSHPLHHQRGAADKTIVYSEGRGQERGRGGASRRRGRGQPDMRLRMNLMLEKIKRDFN